MSRVRFHCLVVICALLWCIDLHPAGAEIIPIDSRRPMVVEPLPQVISYGSVSDPIVLKGEGHIPLAVPSIGSAARVAERFEDLLPVVERPYQADRIWGYWLGYSPWNAYSFYLSRYPLYWDWYWARLLDQETTSVSAVPEPSTVILMVLGGFLILGQRRLAVSLSKR